MSYFTEMGALLNEAMNMKDDRLRRDKKESTLNESVEKKEVAEKKPAKKANYWSQAANKLEESLYDKVNNNVNKYLESEDDEEDKKELEESVITEGTMWDKVQAHLNMVESLEESVKKEDRRACLQDFFNAMEELNNKYNPSKSELESIFDKFLSEVEDTDEDKALADEDTDEVEAWHGYPGKTFADKVDNALKDME